MKRHVGGALKGAFKNWMIACFGACALAAVAPGVALAKNDCVTGAAEIEDELGIPRGLLASIAMVESGVDGAPNPRALSIGGRPIPANNANDVARRLRDKNGRLRNNAYVGCMQISLQAHKNQFDPVEKIADPKENVRFAGELLVRLHTEEGNWRSALARYNGTSVRKSRPYVCKVWRHLNEFDEKSARLLESADCQDAEVAISPRTRQVYRNAQVVEIN